MQYMHIDLQISEGPKVHGPLLLGGRGQRPCYRGGPVTAAIGEKNGDPFSFSTICPPPWEKKRVVPWRVPVPQY